jgi:protein SCO1
VRRRKTVLNRFPALVLAAAVALPLLTIAACGPAESSSPDVAVESESHDHGGHDYGAHAHHGAHDADGLPADEPAGFSIYHATSTWTDQNGQRRPLDSLAGRFQVVAMVYTSCGDACPRMLLDMKRIEGELPAELRDRVGFVIVTLDPERDTPERLAEYARGARLDDARWTLLHGDPGDILELAALLGVQYRAMGDGDFLHSNLLTVLDPAGQVVHRQVGLGADPGPSLQAIRGPTAG